MRWFGVGRGRHLLLAILWCALANPVAAQPYNVRLLGQMPGLIDAVYVAGRYAYIGNTEYFLVVDVGNPASPVHLGSLFLPPSWVNGIYVRDNFAYLANGTNGLRIVDVTNPSSPTLRGSYRTSHYAEAVFAAGGLAYITEGDGGLEIVSVTNPSSPTLVGSYDTPDLAWEVVVSDGLAYVADRSSLQILDVTNPSSPTLRGSYRAPTGGRIWNVFVSNGVAYVTATTGDYLTGYYARFLSLDITNPAVPRLLGSYGTPLGGPAADAYVSGGFGYGLLSNGLYVLDVSLPSRPRLRGFYPFYPLVGIYEGFGQVCVSGDIVYIAAWDGGFLILEFTPPPLAANHWQLYR